MGAVKFICAFKDHEVVGVSSVKDVPEEGTKRGGHVSEEGT